MTSFKEDPRPWQFVLSEGEGQISRDNITIDVNQNFPAGTVLVSGAGGYTAWASGAGTLAIAGSPCVTDGTTKKSIAAITRAAEVSRHAIRWPAGSTDTTINAGAVELAKQMIIVRGAPASQIGLPSPAAWATTLEVPASPGAEGQMAPASPGSAPASPPPQPW